MDNLTEYIDTDCGGKAVWQVLKTDQVKESAVLMHQVVAERGLGKKTKGGGCSGEMQNPAHKDCVIDQAEVLRVALTAVLLWDNHLTVKSAIEMCRPFVKLEYPEDKGGGKMPSELQDCLVSRYSDGNKKTKNKSDGSHSSSALFLEAEEEEVYLDPPNYNLQHFFLKYEADCNAKGGVFKVLLCFKNSVRRENVMTILEDVQWKEDMVVLEPCRVERGKAVLTKEQKTTEWVGFMEERRVNNNDDDVNEVVDDCNKKQDNATASVWNALKICCNRCNIPVSFI